MTSAPTPDPDARAFALPACLGGWCALRDHCQHHHAVDRRVVSERLCVPGRDGFSDIAPVRVTMPQSHWAKQRAVAEVAA